MDKKTGVLAGFETFLAKLGTTPENQGLGTSGLAIVHSAPGNSIHERLAIGIPYKTGSLFQELIPIDFHLLKIGLSCLISLSLLTSVVYKILHSQFSSFIAKIVLT